MTYLFLAIHTRVLRLGVSSRTLKECPDWGAQIKLSQVPPIFGKRTMYLLLPPQDIVELTIHSCLLNCDTILGKITGKSGLIVVGGLNQGFSCDHLGDA